jgi:cytochrome oxidase Cu insertion factor (SCO1/SenC/PrrC family)
MNDPSPEDRPPAKDRLSGEDRAAKFSQDTPWIPRKAVVVAVVAFIVLGLGGVLADHFFGGPVSTTVVTAGTNPPGLTTTVPTVPATTAVAGSELPASLTALLGLTKTSSVPAPGFSLETPDGERISVSALHGKLVILTFFDSACNDICPVLATEIRLAVSDLGTDASSVEILTINTDPLATAASSASAALRAAGSKSLPEWHFLTGTLKQLNAVWKAYGVTIDVQTATHRVSHNDVLYFIDQNGLMRFRATPFADESAAGTFSLASNIESKFASGLASTARALLGRNGGSA